MRRLVLATTNNGKILEIKELLQELPLEIVGLERYPESPAVEETGATFMENAVLKAQTIARYTGELTLADDSGLVVDCLGGEPGIYSARYGQPGWNDRQRYEYLLEKLKAFGPELRQARFHCAIALCDPVAKRLITAEGTVEGVIAGQPSGNQGFGYDPVFYLPQLQKTVAELPERIKNQLSHRARALEAIKPKLVQLLNGGY